MGESGHMDRRRLLASGGMVGIGALLAACGGSTTGGGGDAAPAASDAATAAPPATSTAAAATDAAASSGAAATASAPAGPAFDLAAESGELVVFDWQGYEIDPFWKAYNEGQGTKVPLKFVFLEDDQQALAKVQAGFEVDVAHPCLGLTNDWLTGGLIQPWDTTQIAGFENVPPKLYSASTIDGKIYGIPWDWGFTSIIYRADRIDPALVATESWKLLLDPSLKKRAAMTSDGTDIIAIGHLINKGAVDPYTLTTEEIDAAKETMLGAVPNVRNFWTAETDTIKDFVDGNLDVTVGWPGTWYQIRNALPDADVRFMTPAEGRLSWVCGYVLSATTKKPGSAHKLMEVAISPETSAALINTYAYGAAGGLVPEVIAQIEDKTLIKAFSLDDPAALDPPRAWPYHFMPNRRAIVKAAEEIKASA